MWRPSEAEDKMVELMKKLNLTYEEPTIFIMEDKNKEHLMSLEYE
jgi:hypothetical protein